MKTKAEFRWLLLLFCLAGAPAFAAMPDSTGLPGDHLDLRATLELFKESKSPEEFEKKLNTKGERVNNLDLNGDGEVDYLRVYDIQKGDVHAIVIQDPINKKESQDIAVIEIEKKGDKSAAILIRGDEEIYGKDYVIAPKKVDDDSDDSKKMRHSGNFANTQSFVFVNVWYWPCVQYIYYPSYVIWMSPWYWDFYPWWWYPWPPYPFYTYYGWTVVYYDYYYTPVYVLSEADGIYKPRRVVSQTVQERYAGAHARYEQQQKKAESTSPSPAPPRTKPGQQPKADPAPSPRQNQDEKKIPVPKPREDVKPVPAPAPRPVPAPKPRPKYEPKPPRTIPTPRPPSPRPMPAPTPRPVPRPR